MSVEHHADQICLVCDECGDNGRDFHASDFDEMVVEAKRKGWKIENRRGQYFHTCPGCQDEMAEFGLDGDE
jgi:Fe2+ or Zn2+ uptake regulation protein